MKVGIGKQKPEHYREYWPGQYDIFSHFEYVSGIPQALFLITTLKETGKPNACFHSWSAFSGDKGGFYAIMSGLLNQTHTYKNIIRDKEFCLNFISSEYYDACIKTIDNNDEDADEIAAGGFTAESSKTIKAPRIKEAFLSFECSLHSAVDLSGKGISSLIVGEVQHAAVLDNYHELDKICSKDGFMFNVHSPKDVRTGEGHKSAVTILNPVRILGE